MKKLVTVSILVFLLAAVAVGGILYLKDRRAPELTLTPGEGYLGAESSFSLTAVDPTTGIKNLSVIATQKGRSVALLKQDTFANPLEATVEFDLSQTKFRNGPVSITVSATDRSIYNMGQGNTANKTWEFKLDTKKPRVVVLSGQHNLNRGGSGCVAYTVNEDVSKSGVQIGDEFFRGYKQANGNYLCLFAFPQDMTVEQFSPVLIATDKAGNTRKDSFYYHVNDRKFRHDVINLPDRFLNAKMPQFEDEFPDAPTQLERYLMVNRELRVKNRAAMHKLGSESTATPMWEGRFSRLPNAANRAGFGDRRTYKYAGKDVDHQTHLGIDLASVRHAPIPAANNGKVVHTGFFGIYGESVVIDHGLGLMSLYSHMSSIDVSVGDMVKKNQIIGRTGATGLAGGDHLHFGVFVGGVPVNPIEWWDGRWIDNNITSRMN